MKPILIQRGLFLTRHNMEIDDFVFVSPSGPVSLNGGYNIRILNKLDAAEKEFRAHQSESLKQYTKSTKEKSPPIELDTLR